jgi:hypothetical protein
MNRVILDFEILLIMRSSTYTMYSNVLFIVLLPVTISSPSGGQICLSISYANLIWVVALENY